MKYMYFGTRERMAWIPCPAIDADVSKVGWSASGRFINGGGYVRRSATAGKVYQFSWNVMPRAELRKFTDYADGLYGPGPFYFIDPFSTENILPQYWAAPRLAAEDAPSLVRDKRPELVDTPANNYGYPTKSAKYVLEAGDSFNSIWLPVPEGHTLHLGVHGTATGDSRLTATPDGGSPVDLEMLPEDSAVLTDHSVVGPTGVTLSGRLGADPGVLTLSGIVAALVPNGQSAPTGNFPSGQGHSGCDFTEHPKETGYSAALDKIGATATLMEVGGWL